MQTWPWPAPSSRVRRSALLPFIAWLLGGTASSLKCSRAGLTAFAGRPHIQLRLWLRILLLLALAPVMAVAQRNEVPLQQPAPDFTLRTLAGGNLRLSEQVGSVVLVHFWATWCTPCRQQMPELERLHQRYQRAGLVVLGVNLDEPHDVPAAARLAKELGPGYPQLLDEGKAVSRRYAVRTLPLTVLMDREGRIRAAHTGYHIGDQQAHDEQLRALLNE